MDEAIIGYRFECRCCRYRRPGQISHFGGQTWLCEKSVRIILAGFLASVALFAICVYRNQFGGEESASFGANELDDVTNGRRLLSRREMNTGREQEQEVAIGNEQRPPPVEKRRRSGSSEGTKHRYGTPYGFPKKDTRKVRLLKVFKSKVIKARSFTEILSLLEATGLCRSISTGASSFGHPRKQRRKSAPLNATTTTTTTTMTTTTPTTCLERNVRVVGTFGHLNETTEAKIRVCDPKDITGEDRILETKTMKYSKWMNKVTKDWGICRPMNMVVDLDPVKDPDHRNSDPTIAVVRKCSPLYKAIRNETGNTSPTCVSVKSVNKTVTFRRRGGVMRSYVIEDDVICQTTSEAEDKKKRNSSRKNVRFKCPWPFKLMKAHCSCLPRDKGSSGYLIYRTCQRIQNGFWTLQDRQMKCVSSGSCLQPKCNASKVYDPWRGSCVDRLHQPYQTRTVDAAHSQRVQDRLNSTSTKHGPNGGVARIGT